MLHCSHLFKIETSLWNRRRNSDRIVSASTKARTTSISDSCDERSGHIQWPWFLLASISKWCENVTRLKWFDFMNQCSVTRQVQVNVDRQVLSSSQQTTRSASTKHDHRKIIVLNSIEGIERLKWKHYYREIMAQWRKKEGWGHCNLVSSLFFRNLSGQTALNTSPDSNDYERSVFLNRWFMLVLFSSIEPRCKTRPHDYRKYRKGKAREKITGTKGQ